MQYAHVDHTVGGKQANMYLQQRITLQQKLRVLHSLSAHIQIFVSNVILWYLIPN